MKKLPQELCIIVSKRVGTENQNRDKIMEIMKEIAARERANAAASTMPPARKPSHDCPTALSLATTNSFIPTCLYYGEHHTSASCKTVTDANARMHILVKEGRCFVCLNKRHIGGNCKSSGRCYICQARHHTSICSASRKPRSSASPTLASSSPSLRKLKYPLQQQHSLETSQNSQHMSTSEHQYCCRLQLWQHIAWIDRLTPLRPEWFLIVAARVIRIYKAKGRSRTICSCLH